MKTYQLECPSCGAAINAENIDQKKAVYCTYCGRLILLDDEVKRVEVKYHKTYTNEARVKESEAKERIREKELEYKERENKRNYWKELLAPLISIGAILLFFAFWSLIPSIFLKEDKLDENELKISADAESYHGENYEQVVRELEDMGFTNVDTMRQEDLVLGWLTKDGEVAKVSINGDTDFAEGDVFPKDANVVVTYHTFEEE